VSVFGLAGSLGVRELAIAGLMGAMAVPGAFIARTMVDRMPLKVHTAILDAVVVAGGVMMLASALTR
jgi:uncharacterized membrane protein YfcA